MLRFNQFVTLSFLFFFSTVVSDDDCLWCPLGSAIGNGAVEGAEWLWDGAVGATDALRDFFLPPSQPPQPNQFVQPDTPTITENKGSPTDDLNHLDISATQHPKPLALTDDECDPRKPVVRIQTDVIKKKAIELLKLVLSRAIFLVLTHAELQRRK